MTSITALFSSTEFGTSLANVSAMAMRPTFELQFSLLQDQVIQRLNADIEKANQDTGKVDAFLVLQKARLDRMSTGLDDFQVQTSRNHNLLADISDSVGDMTAAADTADAGDASAFDNLLATLNDAAERLNLVNGTVTGIMFEDGVRSLKSGGVVRTASGDKATSFADFATVAEAKAAIVDAVSRLTKAQVLTDSKIDLVVSVKSKISGDLLGLSIDMEAARTAEASEKADAIAKLKEKYGHMLNALSLGFEASAAMAENLAKQLSTESDLAKGSVMNLFT